MSADRLIELMERRGDLNDRLASKLRAKVADSPQQMSAEMLAKFLVQKKHLSEHRAKELLNVLANLAPTNAGGAPALTPAQAVAPPIQPRPTRPEPPPPSSSDEINNSSIFSGLLPASVRPPVEGEMTLAPSDELDEVENESAAASADDIRKMRLSQIDDLAELSAIKQSAVDVPPLMDEALTPDVFLSSAKSPSSVMRAKAKEDRVRKKIEKKLASKERMLDSGRPKKKIKRKNEWDSPLLLIGGGALVLMLLIGGVVGFILSRQSGDRKLEMARTARKAGAFQQAIEQYDEFLKKNPRHAEWSAARVEMAMSRLRQASEGGSNFESALKIAKDELPAIENEPKFGDGDFRRELAELLPQIAQGLANQAEAAADPKDSERLVAAATEALGLCNTAKYVPKTYRNDTELDGIGDTLARISKRQETRGELTKTLDDMNAANEAGDPRAAYAAQVKLLEHHPELSTNEELAAAVVKASNAEKAGVKFVVEEKAPETTERPTPWLAMLATANRHSNATAPATGIFVARIDGAVYGFDVSNGQLLWRRYVGFQPAAYPIAVGEHVLVSDSKYQELLRLDAKTGRLIWRQEFGGPFAAPLAVGDRAFVATDSGRLYIIDINTGTRMGYLQFAQLLRVPPMVDRRGERLYMTGDHSSIYAISLKDLKCIGVYYLGHASGSIRVPPAQALEKLVVLENDGVATSRMRILSVDQQGAVSKSETERRLGGLAAFAPLVTGRRVIAVTDRGELDAFDVGSGEGKQSLNPVAKRDATAKEPLVRHVLLTQGAIWIADTQLAKYAVQPTGDRLPVQTIDDNFAGATFDHPLGLYGNVIVHVRRPAGRAGAIVAASDTDHGQVLWETELAVPPLATPTVDNASRTLAMADANGFVFRFDDQAMRSRVQDQPLTPASAPSTTPKLTVGVDLGQGRASFAAPGDSDLLLVYDPAQKARPAQWLKLSSTVACAPSPLGKGVLVPTEVGQVFYLDSATGQPLAAAFQPRLRPRLKLRYQPAAQTDDAGRQFVITDGDEKIYLVNLVDKPQPHFEAATEASVGTHPIVSRVVVAGKMAFAATDGDTLVHFQLPTLASAGETNLSAAVVGGPYRVGDLVLVVTADEKLVAVRPDGNTAWTVQLELGDLAGPPLATDDGLLLAYRKGILEHRKLADGSPVGKLDVEHPLEAGPVRFMQHIVLATHDGTLLVVDQP